MLSTGEFYDVECQRKVDINAFDLRVRLRDQVYIDIYFKIHQSNINEVKHFNQMKYEEGNQFAKDIMDSKKIFKILVFNLEDFNYYESRRAFGEIIFEDNVYYSELLRER